MKTHILTRCPLLLTLMAGLLAWPPAMTAGTPGCGIRGQTFVHDSQAVNIITSRAGSIAPSYASLRVYSVASNRLVTTITTDAEGRFQVQLRPGSYRVVPDTMRQGQVAGPGQIFIGSYETASAVTVRVRPHYFAPLVITYERAMGY